MFTCKCLFKIFQRNCRLLFDLLALVFEARNRHLRSLTECGQGQRNIHVVHSRTWVHFDRRRGYEITMTLHFQRNVMCKKKTPRTVIPFATNAISRSCCWNYFCSAGWWCGLQSMTSYSTVMTLRSGGVNGIATRSKFSFLLMSRFKG
jgi:hypothetical protein